MKIVESDLIRSEDGRIATLTAELSDVTSADLRTLQAICRLLEAATEGHKTQVATGMPQERKHSNAVIHGNRVLVDNGDNTFCVFGIVEDRIERVPFRLEDFILDDLVAAEIFTTEEITTMQREIEQAERNHKSCLEATLKAQEYREYQRLKALYGDKQP